MKKNKPKTQKKKRKLSVAARTAIGMAAAFVLAAAGYFVPGTLLNAHVDGMLEQKQTIVEQEVSTDVVMTLDPQEYGEVLSLWYGEKEGLMQNGLVGTYHNPVVGQISMSVAIDTANAVVETFVDKKMLPESCLYEKLSSRSAALYNASMDVPELDYRASFWEVTLQNSFCDLSFSINAVTAEVWSMTAWVRPDGDDVLQNWCYASPTGRIEGYVEYLGSGGIEDYEELINYSQIRAILKDVPYDILSEQTSVEGWLDGDSMWLRLRMIPKNYTFQNLIDEYEKNGMDYVMDEMYSEVENAQKWR